MNPHLIQEARNAVQLLLNDFPELQEDAQLRADMIEAETSLHDVIRQLLLETKAADGLAKGLNESVLALKLRQSRLEHREERLRATILSLMQTADLPKLPLPEGTLSVTQRAPAPIRPETADGLPDEFVRVKREPDMRAISAAIKEGREVPGIAMSNGGVSLTIRSA